MYKTQDSISGLVAENLSVHYSGVTAVDGLDLRIHPGQIVGLIGPNGAGKTSVLDALTGFSAYTGTITLDGESIDELAPFQRCRRGIARTWQSGELFGTLSVQDNLMVTTAPPSWRTVLTDLFAPRRPSPSTITELLDTVGLGDLAGAQAKSLTLGHQKLVGVARALASDPRIILLDEPAAGLDTGESREFAGKLRGLVGEHRGALLIDHDIDLMLGVCDVIYVIEFGRLIFVGPPDEVRGDARVVAAYLGSPVEE